MVRQNKVFIWRCEIRVLVAGAGGFIGGHLSEKLRKEGNEVVCIDIKSLDDWFQSSADAENIQGDLRDFDFVKRNVKRFDAVYNLACDMGGMGFISTHRADCMVSVLINTNLLRASIGSDVKQYFFASSACVYSEYKQSETQIEPLKESDAYPAMPEDGYGWEKLFSERMCIHFKEEYGLETRIARFHNVYGPFGTFDGGREKAPAAICRKVAESIISGRREIEVWGDGLQTRSFMFISDCLKGIEYIMNGEYSLPINLGSASAISINDLVKIVSSISKQEVQVKHNLQAPQGVRGRNSDNTLIRQLFDWEPSLPLNIGLEETYSWIYSTIRNGGGEKFRKAY